MVTLSDRKPRRAAAGAGIAGAILLLASSMLTACAAPAVDTACDLTAARDEIEHIVSESGLGIGSVDVATCADSWTYVVATIDGPDSEPSSDRFLFRQDTDMLVLMAPESVCENQAGNPEGLPVVPEALRAQVCES